MGRDPESVDSPVRPLLAFADVLDQDRAGAFPEIYLPWFAALPHDLGRHIRYATLVLIEHDVLDPEAVDLVQPGRRLDEETDSGAVSKHPEALQLGWRDPLVSVVSKA